ncbi:CLUMA_CG000017, isoform A [Clunio marinus]|uniref:CLUMA_CG000017, isoform A n=1 Tax=Clunio marinus TaxID=568069 RepID=A0A1J1HFA4_9DIPT|nr:CLUMA_CG000017, isoform A [Clunio marinus]
MVYYLQTLPVLFIIGVTIRLTKSSFCHESEEVKLNCVGIFEIVHKCNAEFIQNAMTTADPFTLCTNDFSFRAYRITMKYYDRLFSTHDPKNESALCSDQYLNKNKMNVITSLIGNSKNLWTTANCDQCYNTLSSTSKNFTTSTEDFLNSLQLLTNCIDKVTNISFVCNKCETHYQTLNGIYERIKTSSNNKICFDLEDKMNKTRRDWSGVYKCCRDKRDSLTAFYSLATTIFIIAVSFYSVVYFVGSNYPERNVLDEREVAICRRSEIRDSAQPGQSSNMSSFDRNNLESQKKSTEQDNSDNEPLILSSPLNQALERLN